MIKELADQIIDTLLYDEELIRMDRHEFELEDCVVEVTGNIHGDFRRFEGDCYTPHYEKLIGQTACIDDVSVFSDCKERKFTNEELIELEKLLTW